MDFLRKENSKFTNDKIFFKSVGIIILIVMLVLIITDFRIYHKKRKLTEQINNYQEQIADIKKSSQTLKDEIANADNVDYLEKLGYEQFNKTKPGETEYMFIKNQNKLEVVVDQKNFWQNLTGWFSELQGWIKGKF